MDRQTMPVVLKSFLSQLELISSCMVILSNYSDEPYLVLKDVLYN